MNTKYFVNDFGVIYSIYSDWQTNFSLAGGLLHVTDDHGVTTVIGPLGEKIPASTLKSADSNTVYVLGPEIDGAAEVLEEYQLWTSLTELANAIEQVPK